jgi:hypothetical protein
MVYKQTLLVNKIEASCNSIHENLIDMYPALGVLRQPERAMGNTRETNERQRNGLE